MAGNPEAKHILADIADTREADSPVHKPPDRQDDIAAARNLVDIRQDSPAGNFRDSRVGNPDRQMDPAADKPGCSLEDNSFRQDRDIDLAPDTEGSALRILDLEPRIELVVAPALVVVALAAVVVVALAAVVAALAAVVAVALAIMDPDRLEKRRKLLDIQKHQARQKTLELALPISALLWKIR